MLIKALFKYKWFVLCSVVMTILMITSSLLQPWLLKQVLDALQVSDGDTIYRTGGWLIGMGLVGLIAGGINVTMAAYIAQAVSSDLREKTFRKIQTFSYANIEQFNAGNLVVRMTNDINQIQNLVMMMFQILLRLPILFVGSVVLAIATVPSLWWIIALLIIIVASLTGIMMGMMGPRYGAVYIAIWALSGMVSTDAGIVSAIASFIGYLNQIIFTIIMVGFLGNGVTRAIISMRRINEVLGTEPAMTFQETVVEDLEGSISFEHVTFTYPTDDTPILKDISFDVAPGQMIGVVGATGAGKSTLAQLIPRLFDPQEGAIKIGGKDLRNLSQASLRKNISIVLQKAILFKGTIADNLRQGKLDASLPEMERAAQIAQASEFINRMKESFDSEVEERGSNFSGGQKQRMSIARGVVSHPNILILDDSTSALDAKSEKLVQEALNKDLQGTTTIIIAQKISSVVHADKILVLDQGRLIGQGTHAELVASNDVYREIYETQKGKEE